MSEASALRGEPTEPDDSVQPSSPRYLQPEVRRRQILDAAGVVIAKRGFSATRISDVAEQAGIAQGTIYRFFQSKDELALAIFENGGAASRRALERIMAEGDAEFPDQMVREYIRWYAQFLDRQQDLVHALFAWELDPAGRRGRDLGDRKWIAEQLTILLQKSGIERFPEGVDPGALIPLVVYSLTALSHLYATESNQSKGELASTISALLERLLGLEPESTP
jgi:AcrR family transcriptional regulator